MYMATRYIGGKYTPGEIIGDDLSTEQLKWLVKTGAVKEINPPPDAAFGEIPAPGEEAEDEAETQTGEEETTSAGSIDGEGAEEPAPEIDVMSGIVSSPPASEGSKKRSATKKGGKK